MNLITSPCKPVSAIAIGIGLLLAAVISAAAQSSNGLDFASFQIIGQRNIFDPNRVPHRRSSSPVAHVVDSFSFVGTMSYAKGNFAFFDGSSADFRKVLELDGSIADFKVTGINPRSVTLLSGTNETVLPLGRQMYRDDNGHWTVSAEPASYASAGGSSGSDRRSVNRPQIGGSPRGSAITTDNLPTDDSYTPPPNGAPDMATPESPPVAASGNDALSRLMQRRAEEEQRLGQRQ
jgi:hypothetical protein